MIKAILMDFNGVIINDEPLHMQGYQHALKNEGIDLSEEEYYSCLGMDDVTFTNAAFQRVEKDASDEQIAAVIEAKTAKWIELVEKRIPLFDGIENFIKKMEKDFALGIVSMAQRKEIEFVLEKTGLRDCFMTIVSAEDVVRPKPDPECYLTGFNLIDAERTRRGRNPMVHKDCLAIEDSPPGIVSANLAGLMTLGVTNTVSERRLREAGAYSVAKDLNDWMPESMRQVFV
ncbi:MAG: HAD family phosphatase [Pyrinomonadaceae bacterium]|nr:HAD family phosphatase [Pyrinomonadaceae bacterium]